MHSFPQIFAKRFSLTVCADLFFCVEERREEKIASGYARVLKYVTTKNDVRFNTASDIVSKRHKQFREQDKLILSYLILENQEDEVGGSNTAVCTQKIFLFLGLG